MPDSALHTGAPMEPAPRPLPGPPPPAHLAALPPARWVSKDVLAISGVPYADLPGRRPLELDLWLPSRTDSPAPAVVFLHGGGWRLGSRHSAGPSFASAPTGPFEQLASAGLVVASVDYRLSGESNWPAQLHDVKAAVRWLRRRGPEFGVDSPRIAAWGESAGGHLAELLGLTGKNSALEGNVGISGDSSVVSAVVAWYAPSDIGAVAVDQGSDPDDPTSREAQLLGAPVPTVPELAEQASPLTHVSSAAPPFLLLHGGSDRLIPCVQSRRLYDALTVAGVASEFHVMQNADHMWLGAPSGAVDAMARTVNFLQRMFNISPATRREQAE